MSDSEVSKELVLKAAKGDRAAFEELYQGTYRSVYFTCLNILKDEQEAQDITQDVYLTAFEKLDTLEDADKFKPWLYRIAANKSIKHLKKKKPSLPGDEQLQDMETEENENFLPEEYVLNVGKRELVLDIARKVCTDAQYQSILLFYFNELSVAEIAEIMECQESNVKKRLSIARTKIKEGVLQYEKKSGDKLYSIAVVPFLTALFTAQMQDMHMPSLPLSLPDAIPQSTLAASSAKAGGRMVLKGLQLKIAAGVAAAVVVGGVAAAVTITNQRAEEASAGALEESTVDVAGLENTGDTETSAVDTDVTELDEDTAQDETGTASESDITDESKGIGKAAEETEAEEEITAEEPETAEVTPEPTVESEYTYTDMSATMYATQTVNVRTLPSTDGEKVGSLSTNQEVNVTGQCNETSWYRFEYNGQTAYVSNSYVSDTKIEVAAAEPAAEQAAASGSGTAGSSSFGLEGLEQYPVYTWLDYGDWFMYIAPDGQNHNYSNTEQVLTMMYAFDSRYPGQDYNGDWCFLKNGTFVQFFTVQDPWPQGYIDFMRKYYDPNFVPYR